MKTTEATGRVSDENITIRNVKIHSFRGIPQELNVVLSREGKTLPVIISGDSGTGKSSIVDAAEFACIGTIGGLANWTGIEARTPWSFASHSDATASVIFSNGAVIRRVLTRQRDDEKYPGISESNSGHLPLLNMARISWKREDIITFLSASPHDRGRVFAHYFEHTLREMTRGDSRLNRTYNAAQSLSNELAALRKAQDRDIGKLVHRFRLSRPPKYKDLPFWLADRSRELDKMHGRDAAQITSLISEVERRHEEINKRKVRTGPTEDALLFLRQAQASGGRMSLLLHELMRDISDDLSQAFRVIAPSVPVSRIEVLFGRRSLASLEIEVKLANNIRCSPHNIFSEGYLDALAILFFVTVAMEAAKYGQARILILDDVVQSVDAPLRVRLFQYIAEKLAGWQLIITVHDRLWREQLIRILRERNPDILHCEVKNWSFQNGPLLSGGHQALADPLKAAIADSDPETICMHAGLLAEQLCDRLSIALATSVPRRDGDRYTMGDMWPGVLKALRRTAAASDAIELERWVYLRNMAGAHHNEWAATLPRADAEAFAEATLCLLYRFYCEVCLTWIKRRGDALSCRCGAVTMPLPSTR